MTLLQSLSKDRNYYMGTAIILVLFYHLMGACGSSFKLLKIFMGGYIGVDIFLFLSGLGLCHSYDNHTLKDFYKRRFVRIYPLFLLFAIIRTLMHTNLLNIKVSLWDWFCNLTTLSYYQIGGFFIDWYLSALFILYLLFPIFRKKTNIVTISLSIALIIIIYYFVGRPYWTYDCLISRIPIFMAGIYMHDHPNKFKQLFWGFTLCLLPVFLLNSSNFLYATLSTPLLFIALYALIQPINIIKIKHWGEILGKYSLEIYIGNCLTMEIFHDITIEKGIDIIVYTFGTILFSIVFVLLGNLYKQILRHRG